ncbi:RHS repeat domain-containing protein, partial [Tenacibaculum finnmarkense]|uniref:RHS repeat domain-containing protein n=1 Tax=Tenacibaculum finnmarkense TaxID=2781243 RepID=UPI00293EA362
KSGKTIVTIDSFTYDHMNRLLSQKQCIGDETLTGCGDEANSTDIVLSKKMVLNTSKTIVDSRSITFKDGFHVKASVGKSASFSISEDNAELITSNTYDKLGQLISKKVGNKESSPLQTVDYKYNIRGWLKNINQDGLNDNDLFNFSLKYNDPTSGTALFNGNISQTSWNTLSQDKSIKTYTYDYDALNRIKSGTGVLGSKYDVSGIKYDKNGNIKTLIRKGHINIDADVFGTMDNLVYSYDNGNKLHSVIDTGNDDYGFKDGNSSDNIYNNRNDDYTYDVNGNMISDANKGITNITYNHLNLPTRISSSIGRKDTHYLYIDYVYDATGVKLSKSIYLGYSENESIYYAGNYIYKRRASRGAQPKLEFFNHPEGYVSPLDADDLSKGFKYIYQYKDHLGNVRLSYTDNDNNDFIDASSEIIEESNYYPFGLKHKGYNSIKNIGIGNASAQKFGFGGKELSQELGIEWMDFGARNYEASLGRWMNLDPLGEKMYEWSPYNYVLNSPLMFVDPNGEYPILITTRSYASFKTFGPGNAWHGDDRRHSNSTKASSRTSVTITHDTRTRETSAVGGKSRSYTTDGKKDATSRTNVDNRSKGKKIDVHSYGNNAAQKGSWDIDQFTKLDATINGDIDSDHILNVSGTISGDDFPNQESMVTDSEGNTITLGAFETSGDREYGPVTDLPLENEGDVSIKVNVNIKVNKKGVFKGVMVGKNLMSIKDWNKQFNKNKDEKK